MSYTWGMRAYSVDLRERIVRAVAGGVPQSVAARTFGVARVSVQRYVERHSATGSLAARLLYPTVRHTHPENLPRSPVIGTDAPVQYEQGDET